MSRLSAEMLRALENPDLRATFARVGVQPTPMDAERFDAFVRSEMRTFQTIIRDNNLKVD